MTCLNHLRLFRQKRRLPHALVLLVAAEKVDYKTHPLVQAGPILGRAAGKGILAHLKHAHQFQAARVLNLKKLLTLVLRRKNAS